MKDDEIMGAARSGGGAGRRRRRVPREGPKKRWYQSTIFLIFAVPAGLIGGLVVLVVLFVWTAREMPVRAADRALLVTGKDLEAHLALFQARESAQTYSKLKYLDGSYDIVGEYEDETGDYCYLNCEVNVEASIRDARTSYLTSRLALEASIKYFGEDITIKKSAAFSWGDQSSFSVIHSGGEPVGNMFITRKKKRIFTLLMFGAYFDDGEAFRELVAPRLAKLKGYKP